MVAKDTIEFGRYRLVNLLGEGGMAKVYRGVLAGPMGFEKVVAIKRIDPRFTADERFIKGLINEARLGGLLRHPNIVEVYEFDRVGNEYYLAMELVQGWTLDQVLDALNDKGLRLTPKAALQIAIQVCRGLHFAHTLSDHDDRKMNLVHRDMKPANIIVSKRGTAKVLDFGIAKSDTNLFKTTQQDTTKGTPVYMSPEQITGAVGIDSRSDVFSMGSILFELLVGRPLFLADNLLAILHRILEVDVGESLNEAAELVPNVDGIIAHCLAKQPENRYASARDLEQELRLLLSDRPSDEADLESFLADKDSLLPAIEAKLDIGRDQVEAHAALAEFRSNAGEAAEGADPGIADPHSAPSKDSATQILPTATKIMAKPDRPVRRGKAHAPPLPPRVLLDMPRLGPPPRRMGVKGFVALIMSGPQSAAKRGMNRAGLLLLLVGFIAWAAETPWQIFGEAVDATVSTVNEDQVFRTAGWAPEFLIDHFFVHRLEISVETSAGETISRKLRVPRSIFEQAVDGATLPAVRPTLGFAHRWVRLDRPDSYVRDLSWIFPLATGALLLLFFAIKIRSQLRLRSYYRSGQEVTARITDVSVKRLVKGGFPVGRRYDLRYEFTTPGGKLHQGSWDRGFSSTWLPYRNDSKIPVLYLPKQPWKNIPLAVLPTRLQGRISGVAKAQGGE